MCWGTSALRQVSILMVSCSRIILDHNSHWLQNDFKLRTSYIQCSYRIHQVTLRRIRLSNYSLRKRFLGPTLLESLDLWSITNFERDTIKMWLSYHLIKDFPALPAYFHKLLQKIFRFTIFSNLTWMKT